MNTELILNDKGAVYNIYDKHVDRNGTEYETLNRSLTILFDVKNVTKDGETYIQEGIPFSELEKIIKHAATLKADEKIN